MFRRITLQNYRTHRDTTIHLGPVTLLIGNNNSGKSNLLAGIRHFSQLVGRARPRQDSAADADAERSREERSDRSQLRHRDLVPHRYRLAARDDPMAFSCFWEHNEGQVEYSMALYGESSLRSAVAGKESIRVTRKESNGSHEWKEYSVGENKPLDRLLLRTLLRSKPPPNFSRTDCQLCERFFRDMAQAFAYHFQPSYLKGSATCDSPTVDPQHLVVPSQLGYEGGNLQEVLVHYRNSDERAFQRFIASLRRFDSSFHGIRKGKRENELVWEFDLGRDEPGRLDEFGPGVVSDGLIKAAAISLLTTVYHPPALILIEEIENGVNPANIQEFINWLWQATRVSEENARASATQFLLTSHSPSVLREFDEHLENVYTVRLDRHGFTSDVRNLAESLDTLIGIGAIDGEITETAGRRTVHIPRRELAELWYSGTIG